ncbi:MAG: transcriptional repressor [Eggerthellaceae bacterium]|jgi:Fur family ferric uptake transcriptional regulator|nr:transcriptional repressor [Eggerthellaceae bacterium]
MKTGSGYKTRQRGEVIAVLENAHGAHVTAKQVHEELARGGSTIGAATVYRQLERLVDEGLARRYNLGPGEAACYEYTAGNPCAHEHCFHCVCTVCGKLYHVECDHLAEIADHLSQEHGFAVDPQRTVFYGVCKECRDKGEA